MHCHRNSLKQDREMPINYLIRIYNAGMSNLFATLLMSVLTATSLWLGISDWLWDHWYNPPDFVLSPLFRPALIVSGFFGLAVLVGYLFKKSELASELDRVAKELAIFSEECKAKMPIGFTTLSDEAEAWEAPATKYQHNFAARVNHVYDRAKRAGYSSSQMDMYSHNSRVAPKGMDNIVYEFELLSQRVRSGQMDSGN